MFFFSYLVGAHSHLGCQNGEFGIENKLKGKKCIFVVFNIL
jgi:hypothetical protein